MAGSRNQSREPGRAILCARRDSGDWAKAYGGTRSPRMSDTLREAGIGNFNIDLIAGLSGQTTASWRESLNWMARLEAPHVSVYIFEIDEDSRLGQEVLLGGIRYGASRLPSEDETYHDIARICRGASQEPPGIRRYEISNFARPGFESVHNLKYWQLAPYIGFGADAHSYDGSRRWSNPESPEEYVTCAHGSEPIATDSTEEKFFVGLRLAAGVRPTAEEWTKFDAPISRFVSEGLLEADQGALRLSNRGVLLSNEVFQEFLNL